MNIQKTNNQQSFCGKGTLTTYKKVAGEFIKKVDSFSTTQEQDMLIKTVANAIQKPNTTEPLYKNSHETKILTELVKLILGKELPKVDSMYKTGARELFENGANNYGAVQYGHNIPEKTGGFIVRIENMFR